MKKIETTQAVGHIICHDITRIVKDVMKDVAFCKGHVVSKEDIPMLLSLGKEHLYVWEKDESKYHENEAAEHLCNLCQSDYMEATPVKEGKIELVATNDGLFVVDVERLEAINSIDEIMIATKHSYTPVKKGECLLGTRVIPLVIDKQKIEEAVAIGREEPLTKLLPYKIMKVGVVTTGSEVYYGRIQDTFTPVLREKLAAFGQEVVAHKVVNDDKSKIIEAIQEIKAQGVDMILCTGGMSVDPDDLTPGAIAASGADVVTYGAPVLPGAMFLLGYFKDGTPIMGLPGCVMYTKTTVFDLVLPRILAGIKITKRDIVRMGHGGLCLGCKACYYPACSFGKGV